MTEDEHKCVACKTTHQAAAWYARKGPVGWREYLCGAEYRQYQDKIGWVQVFPPESTTRGT
jgi:hypothetical protein